MLITNQPQKTAYEEIDNELKACIYLLNHFDSSWIFQVSVVIHAAATVKFNEPLREAWKINVEGTRMVLELAQRMKRVEVRTYFFTEY